MFLIMLVTVYVIDISGFTEWLRSIVKVGRLDLSSPKFDRPFFCPRCLTFWAGVGLAIFQSDWTQFLYGCLYSWAAPYFSMIICIFQDILISLLSKIEKFIK